MAALPSKDEPAYVITSVDHALRLALILQTEGPQRVTDAAGRLGVAVSTAHRLLAMLVYRGFAVQRVDRTYVAGPALSLIAAEPSGSLRQRLMPTLLELVERFGESANVTVLRGRRVVAIAGAVCNQTLRVGNRDGAIFPAHLSSGGRILLAELPRDEVDALYDPQNLERGEEPVDLDALHAVLATVRNSSFAINRDLTEPGVCAMGTAIRDSSGRAVAAISFALPTVRFTEPYARELRSGLVWGARAMGEAIEAEGISDPWLDLTNPQTEAASKTPREDTEGPTA